MLAVGVYAGTSIARRMGAEGCGGQYQQMARIAYVGPDVAGGDLHRRRALTCTGVAYYGMTFSVSISMPVKGVLQHVSVNV